MAVDEALLLEAQLPVLRVYCWSEPTISFGYFGKIAAVQKAWPQYVPMRRWTGGGMVPHGKDFTYTLVIPHSSPLAKWKTLESYQLIHERIATLLSRLGYSASLVANANAQAGGECFGNPTTSDVMVNAQKVAGAAQRRSRAGLLHQGSIQLVELPSDFGSLLASEFSSSVQSFTVGHVLETAGRLAAEKYTTEAWLNKF